MTRTMKMPKRLTETEARDKGYAPKGEAAASLREVADDIERGGSDWIKWHLNMWFKPTPRPDATEPSATEATRS